MTSLKSPDGYRVSRNPKNLKVYSMYTIVPHPQTDTQNANEPPRYFKNEFTLDELAKFGYESISSYDNNIFIGTGNGFLVLLSASGDERSENGPRLKFLKSVQLSPGKRIEEILVHKAQKKLLVLSDSVLRFYNFELEPLEGHPPIKGVRDFSLDMRSPDKEAGLLMVARRRYILHFLLGRQLVLRKEFPWPEPIVSICTNSTTVCIADASAYSLMDIRNGQTTRLFCPPFSHVRTSVTVKPSIVSVDDEEFLVTSPAGEYILSNLDS
ncbi:hypothetical protein DSO57_1007268 [Entomophthora muscae]|uniref:Uncharacterized protein n=1 Tax=Entomophthora muscae TaxID=34485 RepID=A0ACC2UGK0_9FUNG|nr:hypothetical protein DSO57_1007268 [Entomophthora muscae]